jgi:hypothetical protein
MTRNTTLLITLLATIALVAVMLIVNMFIPTNDKGDLMLNSFKDTTTALAFISGAAVGIERLLEAFWTFMGGVVGTYWPLNVINKQVETLVTDLDSALKPFHEDALKNIQALKAAGNKTADELKKLNDAENEIGNLKARFDEIKNLAPDNQRVQLLTAAASQNVAVLQEKFGDFLDDADRVKTVANTAINGVQDFLSSFKDNPGRRLISIYFGAILGVIVAGLFGLDLFGAASGDAAVHGRWSVLLTGVIIGLGSNPTHEVIRAIQEFKKTQKGGNISQPDLPAKPVEPAKPDVPAKPV